MKKSVNKSINQLLKRRNFLLFALAKVPLLALSGTRLISVDTDKSVVQMRERWINRNPFGSIYFAALSMAAEFCSASTVLLALEKQSIKFKFLVTSFEATFVKKAKGKVSFHNSDFPKVDQMLRNAESGQQTVVQTRVTAVNEVGETIASFKVEWSFKAD